MRIVIAGLSKSGTTALFYKIKNSLTERCDFLFEPKKNEKELTSENVLVKVLVDRFGGTQIAPEIFDKFDKKILIVRDPRDQIISSFLYNIRHSEIFKDDKKLEILMEKLKEKEKNPNSVSMLDLFNLLYSLEGKNFREHDFSQEVRFFCRQGIEFSLKNKDYFTLKYEDFVDENIKKLEDYLGFELLGRPVVSAEYKRVERTKNYGDWKNWFTAKDVEFFKNAFYDYINFYGYTDSWQVNSIKDIKPEQSSLYIRSLVRQKIEEDVEIIKAKQYGEVLNAKELYINNLNNILLHKDVILQEKDARLQEKDVKLKELFVTLGELRELNASRKEEINNLILAKNREKAELIRAKDVDINRLKTNLVEKDRDIILARNKLSRVENILESLNRSITFKFLRLYQKLIDFVFPQTSGARRLYDLLIEKNQQFWNRKDIVKTSGIEVKKEKSIKEKEKSNLKFKKILHENLLNLGETFEPHFFTICNLNYLPKARVLAESFKLYNPNLKFDLVLCDEPSPFDKGKIDNIIYVKDIFLPVQWQSWSFSHNITELCTAIKATAIKHFFNLGYESVVYLDPDMEIFGDLNIISENFSNANILLTPHRSLPEKSNFKVEFNEFLFLQRGIFNLGFLGVKRTDEGKKFINWFEERLINYCYDELFRGLFTDQKWADFMPVYFSGVKIIPPTTSGINISAWNVSEINKIEKHNNEILINNITLKIYHWSGSDKDHEGVVSLLGKSVKGLDVLYGLHKKYRSMVVDNDKENFSGKKLLHNYFSNGEKISGLHRQLYRMTPSISDKYQNPWNTIEGDCYFSWFNNEINKKKTNVSGIPDDFDWRIYVYSNADLLAAGIDNEEQAIRHFLSSGINEGRIYSSGGNFGHTNNK